jgi:hypothetical protein
MGSRLLWVWIASVLSACSTYAVQQTSLVTPGVIAPAPASTTGPDFAVLGSYVTSVRDRAGMDDSSLWVARGQAVGTFEYAFRPASVRVTAFSSSSSRAVRGQPSGFANPGGSVFGMGPGAVIRILRDNPRHNLSLVGDLWLAVAPSRTRSSCIDNCEFASGGGTRRDRSTAFMFNTGLQYRLRPIEYVALTLGANAQTLLRNTEVRPESKLGGRSKVRMGAFHPLLDVGVELWPVRWFSIAPMVSWIGPPAPLKYGPTVSVVIRFHVDKEDEPEPRPAAAPRAPYAAPSAPARPLRPGDPLPPGS